MEKTFEDFSRRAPMAGFGSEMLAPRIDIAESKDAINVTAELPGVEEKDVDVTLADGVLTIRGEKKSERDEQDKDKSWHVVERSYGSKRSRLKNPKRYALNSTSTRDQSRVKPHLCPWLCQALRRRYRVAVIRDRQKSCETSCSAIGGA
jgi:hypothetical protein